MMFDPVEERIAYLLQMHTLEELLELCDIEPAEAVLKLVEIGALELPEVEPL